MRCFSCIQKLCARVGPGIKSIIVTRNSLYKHNKEFRVHRVDGLDWDISFTKCIHAPIQASQFKSACRCSIAEQIINFKEEAFNKQKTYSCPVVSGVIVSKYNCHVDHFRPQLNKIINQFVKECHIDVIDVNDIKFEHIEDAVHDGKVIFSDTELSVAFSEFHKKIAELRILVH